MISKIRMYGNPIFEHHKEFLSVIATNTGMDCYFQTFELKKSQWGFASEVKCYKVIF